MPLILWLSLGITSHPEYCMPNQHRVNLKLLREGFLGPLLTQRQGLIQPTVKVPGDSRPWVFPALEIHPNSLVTNLWNLWKHPTLVNRTYSQHYNMSFSVCIRRESLKILCLMDNGAVHQYCEYSLYMSSFITSFQTN